MQAFLPDVYREFESVVVHMQENMHEPFEGNKGASFKVTCSDYRYEGKCDTFYFDKLWRLIPNLFHSAQPGLRHLYIDKEFEDEVCFVWRVYTGSTKAGCEHVLLEYKFPHIFSVISRTPMLA